MMSTHTDVPGASTAGAGEGGPKALDELLRQRCEPIAIIGVGLRFPGGNSTLADFDAFLRAAGNGIRPPTADRWDVEHFTGDHPDAEGKIWAAGFGFLDDIDQFDAPFFGVSPLEAQYVDPQQRILLETTWEALENANIDPAAWRHSLGGVYIGASSFDYALEMEGLPYEAVDGHLAAGISFFPMAGRLSYFLGWRGPSLATDTACASSLTALHLAVQGLRQRECPIAVVGAVCAIHHPRIPVMFSHGKMLAPDGQCKTFDESADGYVRAEGCGVLVLKRLTDAVSAGDRVLALVQGTAIGQDGESAGLTVPNGSAQESVMRTALANARLTPGDIQYVEAHGTGTALGDPIEMGAISDLLEGHHTKAAPVHVASVKTNIGHMEPVAGIGGLVKVILQMREGVFYPHRNFVRPSGRIPWDSIPVTVPTQCVDWRAPVRRALVNSFGFAGGIASVVVEQAPEPESGATQEAAALEAAAPEAAEPQAGTPQEGQARGHVFMMSAKTKRSLRLQVDRYAAHLDAHPGQKLVDICCTAGTGRSHFPLRMSGVVHDRAELAGLLSRTAERLDRGDGPAAGDLRKVAMLFTGQGSQYPGMGQALYRRYPVFRDAVDECDALFAAPLGRSVRDLVLVAAQNPADIHETRFTQPALFTVEYALARLWGSWGVRPNLVIGHSVGEIVAATVAGVFELADAVRLVAARGRLMQSVTTPGGMLGVALPGEEVQALLASYPDLTVAAFNAPSQCTVSGSLDSLAALEEALTQRGARHRRLEVSHAFHSPHMTEVFEEFRSVVGGLTVREPSVSLISNLTGGLARLRDLSDPEYWVRHIAEPVNFLEGMRTLGRRGRHAMIEVGPAPQLIALGRQCVEPGDHEWVASMAPSDQRGDVILEGLSTLYTAGLAIDWAGVFEAEGARRVELPPYAFDRKRYWLPLKDGRHGLGSARGAAASHHPLLGREVTPDAGSDVREFLATVTPESPGYLADHVVMGRTVFPGTGYLEIMLALQDAVHGHTTRPLLDVQVREPLFVDETGVRLRTRMRPEPDGSASVEIVTTVDDDDGTVVDRVHAVGRIGRPQEPGTGISEAGEALLAAGAARRGDPDEILTEDVVYAAYARAGLEYGPAFRRTRAVSRFGQNLAVGLIEGARTDLAHVMPPFLLDAATHAFAAIGDDGESYLPVRYASLQVVREPRGERLEVLLRIDPQRQPDVDRAIDLVILDDEGVVCELRGLGIVKVAHSGPRRGLFTEPRWVKRSSAGQPPDESRRVLMVGDAAAVGGPGPVPADAVPTPAGEGVEVISVRTVAEASQVLARGGVSDVCWLWPGGARPVGGSDDLAPATAAQAVEVLRAECRGAYEELLELLAVLAGSSRVQRVWLVTVHGQQLPGDAVAAEPPASATLWGFGRTLLNEHPAYRTTLVDVSGPQDWPLLVQEWQGRGQDHQVAFRDGLRHVRRLVPAAAMGLTDGNFEIAISEYGQFSDIATRPVADEEPTGDEVVVEVAAAGLNFKDILNALGLLREFGEQPLGFEAAGTVVACGPLATRQVGDEVVVNYLGCFRRRVRVPSAVAVPKPPNVSMQVAAGLAAAYVTASYALHTLAGMKAGDRVLVHAAAGGVGQAAVQLALAAGAEVYATASPHKWALLREQGVRHVMNSRTLDFAEECLEATAGQGVDIVLNSLNKDFIPAGLAALGTGGRFVEMGKVGAWTPEEMALVRPDVRYHNFDLSELPWDTAVEITARLLEEVMVKVADGVVTPIRTTVYGLDEIEEAFGVLSRGANVGKLVIHMGGPRVPVPPPVIDDQHTYLVTGGLGALGLVAATTLADLGARHLVLTGRRTVVPPDLTALLERLSSRADVEIVPADVSVPAGVARIEAHLRASGRPLGGIVHAAGVLSDAPVAAQTWQTIEHTFAPKVYGTRLLDDLARRSPQLQFFVGYSSAAPVAGTPGQANYAAANAYLDNLMVWRSAAGTPGQSINWGPWAEIGMSAHVPEAVLRRWADEGIVLTRPAVGMRALAALLERGTPQTVVGECDWNRFAATRPAPDTLYQRLVTVAGAEGSAAIDLAGLRSAAPEERAESIRQFIRSKVAEVLRFDDLESVDSGVEFVRMGLDSLVAVELKNALESAFRIPLPASVALQYPSVEQLGDFLERQLSPERVS